MPVAGVAARAPRCGSPGAAREVCSDVGQQARLGAAARRRARPRLAPLSDQVDVHPAGEQVLGVPLALAVAEQDERAGGAGRVGHGSTLSPRREAWVGGGTNVPCTPRVPRYRCAMTAETLRPAARPHRPRRDAAAAHSYGPGVQAELRMPSRDLRRAIPDTYAAFAALHSAALAEGVLSTKIKELIALALSVRRAVRRLHRLARPRRREGRRHRGRGRRGDRRDAAHGGRAGDGVRAARLRGVPRVRRAVAAALRPPASGPGA